MSRRRPSSAEGDYWAVNPKGYVPALELDDGQVLTEGPAIVQYLGDRKPETGLVPKAGSMERYRMQEMLAYLNSEIHEGYDTIFNAASSDAAKTERRQHLKKRYALLESQLAGKEYLFGSGFTAGRRLPLCPDHVVEVCRPRPVRIPQRPCVPEARGGATRGAGPR
jgi:glutathione S-transferase